MDYEILFFEILPPYMIFYLLVMVFYLLLTIKRNTKKSILYILFVIISCGISILFSGFWLINNISFIYDNKLWGIGYAYFIILYLLLILWFIKTIIVNKKIKKNLLKEENGPLAIIKEKILKIDFKVRIISAASIAIIIILLISIPIIKNSNIEGYYVYTGELFNGREYTEYIKLYSDNTCEWNNYVATYNCHYKVKGKNLTITLIHNGNQHELVFNSKRTSLTIKDKASQVYVKKENY